MFQQRVNNYLSKDKKVIICIMKQNITMQLWYNLNLVLCHFLSQSFQLQIHGLKVIASMNEDPQPNAIWLDWTWTEHGAARDLNRLRPKQDGQHFIDGIFKCIFMNENVWILIKISLRFAPRGVINNIPALVQIMAWRRPGDKPLSEPMMV